MTWKRSTPSRVRRVVIALAVMLTYGAYIIKPEYSLAKSQFKMAPSASRSDIITNLTSRPDYESVFYKVDLLDEIMAAVNGSPLTPLPDYKTPCWFSKTGSETVKCSKFETLLRKASCRRKNPGQTELRCLPYAMLIGVSKCGTTDLFRRISKHPQIFRSKRKEVRFWNRQRFGLLRIPNIRLKHMTFAEYLTFFEEAASGIYQYTEIVDGKIYHPGIVMEATPHYLWDYGGWENIPGNAGLSEPKFILADTLRELLPDLKFLVILRNPIDRLYSHFRMLSRGSHPSLFHDFVNKSLHLWKNCLKTNTVTGCAYNASLIPYEYSQPGGITLRAGMYAVYLRDWFKRYRKSNFHIIRSEDYYSDVSGTLQQIFRFLGVEGLDNETMRKIAAARVRNINKSNVSEPMFRETRQALISLYQPFNEQLAELLGSTDYLWL